MDAKLERLSSSVSDKYQEAEKLNKQGDELEKQIEIVRQQHKTSPKNLSLQKLELASLQVKLAEVLEQKSTLSNDMSSTQVKLEEDISTLKDLESSFASIAQAMAVSAQQVAHHRQTVSDMHNPLRERRVMQEEELTSLRAELHGHQTGDANWSLFPKDQATDELAALKRKVTIAKLERGEAERMLETLEREHTSLTQQQQQQQQQNNNHYNHYHHNNNNSSSSSMGHHK